MALHFFSEGLSFKIPYPRKTSSWIKRVVAKEKGTLGELNYIFCTDAHLLSINKSYLNHDSYTDIITFDYSVGKRISGDIYISVQRVKENAVSFEVPFEQELNRVIIHGALHLLGYKDKKKEDKTLMRKKEEAYLSLRYK